MFFELLQHITKKGENCWGYPNDFYLSLPIIIEKDLAPKSVVTLKGCQGFKGPVPPPFFISNLNMLRTCVQM
jgi:hypothetical protein